MWGHLLSVALLQMPVCSGLSALIQAATSQLEHLIQDRTIDHGHPASSDWSAHSPHDGYASSVSDGVDYRSSTPTRTPNLAPEDSSSSRFPELLMTVLCDPDNNDIITFLPDGKFFAIRVQEFSQDLLHRHFQLSSYEEFLDQLRSWGFVAISSQEEEEEEEGQGQPAPQGGTAATKQRQRQGDLSSAEQQEGSIQVFRHAHFRRGGGIDLKHVRFSPISPSMGPGKDDPPPMPSLPEQSSASGEDISMQRTMSSGEESAASQSSVKRRLSPSHTSHDRESEDIKQRALERNDSHEHGGNDQQQEASVASHHSDSSRPARRRSSLEIRSKALAVTAAQLSLDDGQSSETGTSKAQRRASLSLVDGGVDKATHNIVTDAIESLLFDEGHTRETYLKHEKELSTSSLPGVVPISKQLFSPTFGSDGMMMSTMSRRDQIAAAAHALHPGSGGLLARYTTATREEVSSASTSLENQNPLTVSPTQLEAAAALVRQASGLKEHIHSNGAGGGHPPLLDDHA